LSRQLNRNVFSCLLKVCAVTSLDRSAAVTPLAVVMTKVSVSKNGNAARLTSIDSRVCFLVKLEIGWGGDLISLSVW